MAYIEKNAASRARVLDLVTSASPERLAAPADGGWTIAALLAHMAFWERVHIGRLRSAVDAGLAAPPSLPDGTADLINAAAIPAWLSVPAREAVRLFEEASAEADRYLAGLDPAAVVAIAAGQANTCALMAGGGVKCWGYNGDGELGDGTKTNSTTPVDVVGLSQSAIGIAVGWVHTCALTAAGGVTCWGDVGTAVQL